MQIIKITAIFTLLLALLPAIAFSDKTPVVESEPGNTFYPAAISLLMNEVDEEIAYRDSREYRSPG